MAWSRMVSVSLAYDEPALRQKGPTLLPFHISEHFSIQGMEMTTFIHRVVVRLKRDWEMRLEFPGHRHSINVRHSAVLLARLFDGPSLYSIHYYKVKYDRCQRSSS